MGEEGKEEEEGGAGLQFSGLPLPARGSRNLAGQPQTPHWPRGKNGATFLGQPPAPGGGGVEQRAVRVGEPAISLVLCVTLFPLF